MGLGELVAAGGELFNRDEVLPLPFGDGVEGGGLSQAADGGEGGDKGLVALEDEAGGFGLVDADGRRPCCSRSPGACA